MNKCEKCNGIMVPDRKDTVCANCRFKETLESFKKSKRDA